MKKLKLFGFILAVLGFTACQKSEDISSIKTTEPQSSGRQCASMDVLQHQLQEDPSLQSRMDEIERNIEKNQNLIKQGRLVNGVIEIPVWVNVIYNSSKPAENIALAQIQSQIDVLNEDFNATNPDYALVPSIFSTVKTSVGIRFVLQGVTRKSSTKTSWRTDNSCKSASKGGISPTNPTIYLNMWSCVLANGILGYAQFPGGSSATDGVVIHTQAFGSRAKYSSGYFMSTYDKGRTATHEVGHWLNLRHIWGDATCGSDLVSDTPTHNTANYGCPASGHLSTCTGTPVEMTMNYMDYTDDNCMYMFTVGQKSRINATFASGGGRNSFAQP